MEQDVPRREPGSRVGVLFVGLLIGAAIMTIVWIVVAGNPLANTNEVVFRDIVVSDVTDDLDSLCWSQDPQRRDAPQECAILALDPALEPPQPGDALTIGVVQLRAPDGTEAQQVIHAVPSDASADEATTAPEPTTSP